METLILSWFVLTLRPEISLQGVSRSKEQSTLTRFERQITTVMEGGEKAFLLRKEKYGF